MDVQNYGIDVLDSNVEVARLELDEELERTLAEHVWQFRVHTDGALVTQRFDPLQRGRELFLRAAALLAHELDPDARAIAPRLFGPVSSPSPRSLSQIAGRCFRDGRIHSMALAYCPGTTAASAMTNVGSWQSSSSFSSSCTCA